MKLKIRGSNGALYTKECDNYRLNGNWIILEEEYTESELAPIPKKRVVAMYCFPDSVEIVEE